MNKNTLSEDGVRYMYNTGSNITLTNNKKMWFVIFPAVEFFFLKYTVSSKTHNQHYRLTMRYEEKF